jgi:hypothetical protein
MRRSFTSSQAPAGFLMVLVLVFGSVLFTIASSFIVFIVTQSRLIEQKVQLESAGQIAEAGLNYYKWYLAHFPNDVTNGTGLPGPYVGVYNDPEGGAIGEYSLSIASTTYCGSIASIDVTSTGHTYENPAVTRQISARYARPTVAEFAFILNSSVWAGPDRTINGPYHSNGGIRMDGTHNSVVTSNVATWNCDSSFGCSPSGNRNGVFTTTANANPALFEYPSAPINFAGLTVDLATMQTRAQNNGGLYIAPSGASGYRVVFNAAGTVSVYRVTSTYLYWGYTTESGWQQERNVYNANTLVGTYAIPATCPLIFVEDKVWLEGTVRDRVALAAADLDTSGVNPSIILKNNITYVSATSSALLAVAEQDVLIGVDVPDDMSINGIYIAQNGRYGRNNYCNNTAYCSSTQRLPNSSPNLRQYTIRNSETMNGTIVSNGRVGTQWTNGGVTVSGFLDRYNTYDRNLVANPPPLVPVTSDVFEFSEWRDSN